MHGASSCIMSLILSASPAAGPKGTNLLWGFLPPPTTPRGWVGTGGCSGLSFVEYFASNRPSAGSDYEAAFFLCTYRHVLYFFKTLSEFPSQLFLLLSNPLLSPVFFFSAVIEKGAWISLDPPFHPVPLASLFFRSSHLSVFPLIS